jgi:hypothetical protein
LSDSLLLLLLNMLGFLLRIMELYGDFSLRLSRDMLRLGSDMDELLLLLD